MLYFMSDYTEGAHPKVLAHLCEKNMVSLPGYGFDESTDSAKAKICAACGRDDLQIQFLVGGTQTNQVAISTLLSEDEAVITALTGHITEHEAGAIEYSGHKVISLPQHEGKIDALELDAFIKRYRADENIDHLVWPKLVYISFPTEYGTLYSKAELTALSKVCRENDLILYMDGARMGYGLTSERNDLTLHDICELTDAFYIGGTKVGALCGEALIFTHRNMPPRFLARIKQHGALLAKMRVVSQQFEALFTDGLYFDIGRHANALARELRCAFEEKGFEIFIDSPTNQQFVVMDKETIDRLHEHAAFGIWEWVDDNRAAVRFATSWATTEESVEVLKKLL